MNYYNEFDPKAAAWLRELIADGLIPPGDVDERSIEDVRPEEVSGYTQCHWFAGIGGWSLALRLAGVPDDAPLWTGSCPCQPFSAAGARRGADDPRHLWPAFRWLIDQCHPATVFGEQVASKSGRGWLAGVRTDLEAMGYGVGAADLCAASVSAPHIRQRLFWVAEGLANANQFGRRKHSGSPVLDGQRPAQRHDADGRGEVCGLPDPLGSRLPAPERETVCGAGRPGEGRATPELRGAQDAWSDYVWIPCADGKARRLVTRAAVLADGLPDVLADGGHPGAGESEAGESQEGQTIAPLAHGFPARVALLKGLGNAIVPQVAAAFITAYADTRGDL